MLLVDGFDFFRLYSNVYECAVGLNTPIESRNHPLSNSFTPRAYYGVVAAALAQPERVESLIQSYIDFARREGVRESIVFDVGKELSEIDALASRLEFVAEAALAAASES